MRYDLSFFLCCCKSFLGSYDDDDPDGDFYALLGVSRDADPDELKRAYKRQSLAMHPDKLAQRGLEVTPELQSKFTKMKSAYECLSDPHKRETYDALGSKAMKWVEEPFSADPQELAHNFAKSSVLDRSKIFAIFVLIATIVFILPVLICLHVDGIFGENASWLATLTPLWIWDFILLLYHARVIMMGPIQKPESVSPQDWVDPLPMKKRFFSLGRFLLLVTFEVLAAMRMDQIFEAPWWVIFIPLYIWEATTLLKKLPLARMRIVTVEDLENALGKPFSEFTPSEKELIGKRYSVVSSTDSPDFEAAQKLKTKARNDITKSVFRITFCVLLILQLDGNFDWSWWLVFLPFWVMLFSICYSQYSALKEVQRMAMEKDPALFAPPSTYGSIPPQSNLSEQEREELRAQVTASSSRFCGKCFSQCFLLLLLCGFVAKLQGAGFSSFWIISPFLFVAALLLCCIGCAIFGVTEVRTDGIDFDNVYVAAEEGTSPTKTNAPEASNSAYVPPPAPDASPSVVVPPAPAQSEAVTRSKSNEDLD